MTSQVATAVNLRNGRTVYLAPGGQWVGALSEAEVARNEAAASILQRRARKAVEGLPITRPVLIDAMAAIAPHPADATASLTRAA